MSRAEYFRKQQQAAQSRRLALAIWQETYDRLATVRPRDETERQAQREALALMEAARPGAEKQASAGHG